MLKRIYFGLLSLIFVGNFGLCQEIEGILGSDFEYKMISSGRNYPTVNLRVNNLGDICVLLHCRIPPEQIRNYFHWSEPEFQNRLDILLREGLIKKDYSFGYLPTCLVIALEDGQRLASLSKDIERHVSRLIVSKLPRIKKRYEEIEGLKDISFTKASLFILSDVLLDNWQIGNVEKRFLKAERTLRNEMHYYFSIQQKAKDQADEAFGIYGNSYQNYGDVLVGLYGNQRQQGINFLTLSKPQLKEWFEMKESENTEEFKQQLLKEFLSFSKNSAYELNDQYRQGFERLGFIENGKLSLPILREEDEKKLSEMAGLITEELTELLERHRNKLKRSYLESTYSQEVSFEEYSIWWYHFFYTNVTDKLVTEGYITKPTTGVFTYVMDKQ